MALFEKLFLVSLLMYLNSPSAEEKLNTKEITSDLTQLHEKMRDINSLRSCSSTLSSLMQSVHAEGKNEQYDSTLKEVTSCISNWRETYEKAVSMVKELEEKVGKEVPQEQENDENVTISFNSMEFDMDDLDSIKLEKKENDLKLLNTVRSTMKSVRSVETVNMNERQVNIHFKEGYDLTIELKKDEVGHSTIDSASLVPPYPSFQLAIEYAIQRNDIRLLTDKTIYGLYAHKRLVNEVEDLASIAAIETEDDVHMKGVFKEGTVIRFELPPIYPNSMGLIKITEIESEKKDVLLEKFEHRAFSDITGLVEYVNRTLNE